MRHLSIMFLLGVLGCSQPAVSAVVDAAPATDVTVAPKPLTKVDILWVLDHSAGSCADQRHLFAGLKAFTAPLQAAGLDVQMAMVTVQQVPDKPTDTTGKIPKIGEFVHHAETKFPPNAIARIAMPCSADAECVSGMDFTHAPSNSTCEVSSLCKGLDGNATEHFANPYPLVACPPGDAACNWRCRTTTSAAAAANSNCSFNRACWRHCTGDQECRDTFETNVVAADQRMICYHPGGSPSKDSGCQMPPPTQDCPKTDDLPAIAHAGTVEIAGKVWDRLDLFRCNLVPGASQTQESKFEGAFRSAWLALDPNGPNCAKSTEGLPQATCQNQQLVRDEAMLVILYVGDDDDCPVNLEIPLENATVQTKAAMDAILTLEVRERCQIYGDRLGTNRWLNEANCQWAKGKKASGITLCACDCRAMAAGSTERAKCEAQVAADWPKFAKRDFRFATPGDFAWRFKSLKKNPNHVIFAAISGLPETGSLGDQGPGDADAISYSYAMLHDTMPGQSQNLCRGKANRGADLGSRQAQMAEFFGGNGLVLNICTAEDFSGYLAKIADFVASRAEAAIVPCADLDGDGFPAASCGGSDCDDSNAKVLPSTKEVCGNGLDDDCDGATDSVAMWVQGLGGSVDLGDLCKPKP